MPGHQRTIPLPSSTADRARPLTSVSAVAFVLSGFESMSSYDDRKPTWEPDDEFEDIEAACSIARTWLGGQSQAAQVEVIEVVGNSGRVRRIVTVAGVEEV